MEGTLQYAELKRKELDAYVRFEVAFQAFNRVFDTIEEARAYARRNDFDTNEIVPVVIACEAKRQAPKYLADKGHTEMEPYHIFND